MFFLIKLGTDQRELVTVRLVQIKNLSSKKTHSFLSDSPACLPSFLSSKNHQRWLLSFLFDDFKIYYMNLYKSCYSFYKSSVIIQVILWSMDVKFYEVLHMRYFF